MKFWKMNGAGNDFVVLNNLEEHLRVEDLLTRFNEISIECGN